MSHWGTDLWADLHRYAVSYRGDQRAAREFLGTFNERVRKWCHACEAHWAATVTANPPVLDRGPEGFFLWTVKVHNLISKIAGKPVIFQERAIEIWGKPGAAVDLILVNRLCPGDFVCLTAVVRELHKAHPGRYRTAIRMPVPELWQGNPHVTPEKDLKNPRVIDLGFTIVGSAYRPRHFTEVWADDLGEKLGIRIPITDNRGDLYLTDAEKGCPAQEVLRPHPYWVVMGGSKSDCPVKAWPYFQDVIDATPQIRWVQAGHAPTWHHLQPVLRGTTLNLIGMTDTRQFLRLIYHSAGVLCPVTYAMHVAGAFSKPAVVISGGREPTHFFQYTGHRVIDMVGALECCRQPCWKSHLELQPGRASDLCLNVVSNGRKLAKCMTMIPATRVIDAILSYQA